MKAPDYRFHTVWRFPDARVDEVAAILDDTASMPRWWPAVYLHADIVATGDTRGVGRVVDFTSRGLLPYRLHWRMTVIAADSPRFAEIEARGDLSGRGVWHHAQIADTVVSTYDWHVRAEKPLLRWGSLFFRPLFRANHDWAMRVGEQSLAYELLRRRGVAAPPPPHAHRP